ncbi:MAG: hypothetical protein U1E77_20720 [Inhella sp.]
MRGGAPNLLLRVRDLGPQRFVDLVLRRYSKDLLPEGGGTPRETLVDEVLERRLGALSMPAWQGDPVAPCDGPHAYLNARRGAPGHRAAGPLSRPAGKPGLPEYWIQRIGVRLASRPC